MSRREKDHLRLPYRLFHLALESAQLGGGDDSGSDLTSKIYTIRRSNQNRQCLRARRGIASFFGALSGFSFWVRNPCRRGPAAAGISGSSDRFPRVGTAGTLSLSPNESRAHACNHGRAPPRPVAVMIFPGSIRRSLRFGRLYRCRRRRGRLGLLKARFVDGDVDLDLVGRDSL